MTALLERSVADEMDATPASPSTEKSGVASWRVAARLARRDVRRRPGRTLLVTLLVLLPVAAMTIGSVLFRSDITSNNSWWFGGVEGDLRIVDQVGPDGEVPPIFVETEPSLAEPVEGLPAEEIGDAVRSVIAGRGDVITVAAVFSDFVASDGRSGYLEMMQLVDGDTSVALDGVEIDTGRAPQAPDEVFLDRRTAERFEVTTGDVLEFIEPEMSLEVVGVGRTSSSFARRFALVGAFDRADVRTSYLQQSAVVRLDQPSAAQAREVARDIERETGLAVQIAPSLRDDLGAFAYDTDTTRTLAWGWVAGVVALIAVGVVVSAAFATSARRQLTTIGQLSANGATEGVIRRTLALQGSWTGVFGAFVGVAIGLVVVFVGWSQWEETMGRRLPERAVVIPDLVIIMLTATVAATVAALVPARSAARIPVLTALAGRRPVGELPRWIAPAGAATFLGGLGLLAFVAATSVDGGGGDAAALVAVLGSLAVMFGLVCSTPIIIRTVGDIASRTRGTVRLAARSLARHRTRSSAVVAAIAVVIALTTAGLTGLGVSRADDERSYGASADIVTLSLQRVGDGRDGSGGPNAIIDPPAPVDVPVPSGLTSRVAELLPNARTVEVSVVAADPAPRPAFGPGQPRIVVVDDQIVDRAGLSDEERDLLERDGAVSRQFFFSDGPSELQFEFETTAGIESIDLSDVVQIEPDFVRAPIVWGDIYATPAWVAERDLPTLVEHIVFVNDAPLTTTETEAMWAIDRELRPFGSDSAFLSVVDSRPPTVEIDPVTGWPLAPFWSVSTLGGGTYDVPWNTIQAVALGAALLLVLFVVAVGLGLAAAEGRDERDVLRFVGAPPKVLRRLAAAKAWVMTFTAAVVAVPTGFVVVWVVRRAAESGGAAAATPPWLAVGAFIVVVPVLAAAVAWIGSAAAARFGAAARSARVTAA